MATLQVGNKYIPLPKDVYIVSPFSLRGESEYTTDMEIEATQDAMEALRCLNIVDINSDSSIINGYLIQDDGQTFFVEIYANEINIEENKIIIWLRYVYNDALQKTIGQIAFDAGEDVEMGWPNSSAANWINGVEPLLHKTVSRDDFDSTVYRRFIMPSMSVRTFLQRINSMTGLNIDYTTISSNMYISPTELAVSSSVAGFGGYVDRYNGIYPIFVNNKDFIYEPQPDQTIFRGFILRAKRNINITFRISAAERGSVQMDISKNGTNIYSISRATGRGTWSGTAIPDQTLLVGDTIEVRISRINADATWGDWGINVNRRNNDTYVYPEYTTKTGSLNRYLSTLDRLSDDNDDVNYMLWARAYRIRFFECFNVKLIDVLKDIATANGRSLKVDTYNNISFIDNIPTKEVQQYKILEYRNGNDGFAKDMYIKYLNYKAEERDVEGNITQPAEGLILSNSYLTNNLEDTVDIAQMTESWTYETPYNGVGVSTYLKFDYYLRMLLNEKSYFFSEKHLYDTAPQMLQGWLSIWGVRGSFLPERDYITTVKVQTYEDIRQQKCIFMNGHDWLITESTRDEDGMTEFEAVLLR